MIHVDEPSPASPEELADVLSAIWRETKRAYQASASGHDDDLDAALDRRGALLPQAAQLARLATPAQIAAAAGVNGWIRSLESEIEALLKGRLEEIQIDLRHVRKSINLTVGNLKRNRRLGGAIFQRDA